MLPVMALPRLAEDLLAESTLPCLAIAAETFVGRAAEPEDNDRCSHANDWLARVQVLRNVTHL